CAIRLFAENRFQRAAAFEYKDDLVGAAVFVILELVVSLGGPRAIGDYILIKQNRDAPGVEIAFARNVGRFEMMMTERTVGDFLQLFAFEQLHVPDARGRPQMIHDRISFIKAFRRDYVLVIDALIFETWSRAIATKPDVMLPRHFAKLLIKWHVDLLVVQIAWPVLLFFERLKERCEITLT